MSEPIICDLSADEPVAEIPSACMNCYAEGTTRLMLSNIPYFKEVIVSSFYCEHCHNSNNSIKPASSYADKGVKYTLQVTGLTDLNRQVIKSEWGSVLVPDVELEIPCEAQQGSSSTVEGFLTKTVEGLQSQQDERRKVAPEVADQIDDFCQRLNDLLTVNKPFEFILIDPSGNSFIENPTAPKIDPKLKVEYFKRTKDDEDRMGITEVREANKDSIPSLQEENENLPDEVISFDAICNACGKEAKCNMKEVDIPFFKKILLMANVCDQCGYKESEVKSAGGQIYNLNFKRCCLVSRPLCARSVHLLVTARFLLNFCKYFNCKYLKN